MRITDRSWLQQKRIEFKNGIASVKISVADLKPGLFYLLIFDGKNWSSKQLFIQK